MDRTMDSSHNARVAVKRLVLCFDGTWNTDKSNTNVSRLFRKIAGDATGCLEQRKFYDEGVGTRWLERIRGGMFGMGLDRNIRQGYAWLADQFGPAEPASSARGDYVAGPDIYLFGFSRGAFTARSLGGLINYIGLPRLDPAQRRDSRGEDLPLIREAWKLYATRPTHSEREQYTEGTASAKLKESLETHDMEVDEFRRAHCFSIRIHFLGVWDTVGALGIPRMLDYAWLPRPSNKHQFHDTTLGACVRFAYHAVAIDEHREPYCVTLWTRASVGQTVEQRWFPGAHADVGGGYEDTLLPDPPLAWIAAKAAERGLHFVNDRGKLDDAGIPYDSLAEPPAAFDLDGHEYRSPVHDSYSEFLVGGYQMLRSFPGAGGRAYRRMLCAEDGVSQVVDPCAYRKLDEDPSYRPPNLAQAGRVDVSYQLATSDFVD